MSNVPARRSLAPFAAAISIVLCVLIPSPARAQGPPGKVMDPDLCAGGVCEGGGDNPPPPCASLPSCQMGNQCDFDTLYDCWELDPSIPEVCCDGSGNLYHGHYVPPPADSCYGRDGETAPAGCSCAHGCGWVGTCCPDVNAFRAPGQTEIGQAFVNIIEPRGATILSMGNPNEVLQQTKFVTMSQPAVIGLTTVGFADIDTSGELSWCRTWCEAGGSCSVQAQVNFDDNKAFCAAGGLRFPNASAWPDVEAPTRHATDGGMNYGGLVNSPTACLGGTETNSVPLLKAVTIQDIDAGNERAGCRIDFVGGGCGWRLVADADDDSDAGCSASLLKLSNGMQPAGVFGAFADSNENNSGDPPLVEYKPNKYRGRREIPMRNAGDHVCFLTEAEFRDLDDGSEKAQCEIIAKNGSWTLVAQVTGWDEDLDADALCEARCVTVPQGGATPDRNAWPVPPTTMLNAEGGNAHLYQNGAYDRPLVFLEGFDPIDKLGVTSYMRKAGDLFAVMASAGFDVWLLDHESGGQPVELSSAEAARTIDTAYRHAGWNTRPENAGKKIPVIGVSMGGVSGRIALSTWQDGTYNSCPASPPNPLCLPGLSPQPPVSAFLSLSSPQDGANIPKSLQAIVQDLGDYHDLGEASSALNSAAAVNMLRERVDPGCDLFVSAHCDAPLGINFNFHGDQTLRNTSNIEVRGTVALVGHLGQVPLYATCSLDTGGCMRRADPGQSACIQSATPKQSFYAGINTRGPRGNGFPNLFSVGMATSAWSLQGDDNMDEEFAESTETPFTTDTVMGRLSFTDTGHGFLGFCDRETQLRAFLTPADLVPGDLSERALTDLSIDGGASVDAMLVQDVPFMHVPTNSALACPNATSDASCQAENTSGGRFSKIYSFATSAAPVTGWNGVHASPDPSMGALIMAHLWEGSISSDGDGVIGLTNPFRAGASSHLTAFDCDDTNPNVSTSATASCTFTSGSCTTTGVSTCSNGTWGSCAPPAEVCTDGLDNNCDGLVDEGCYGVSGADSYVLTMPNVLASYGKAVLVSRQLLRVIVRGPGNQLLPAGVPVELDFSGSTAAALNVAQPPGVTIDCARRTLRMLTNSFSRVDFNVRFGGGADPNNGPNTLVKVRAGGILLRNDLQAMSTDLNMDGAVGAPDEDLFMLGFQGAPGCADVQECPQTDFDLDRLNHADDGDYAILNLHWTAETSAPLCP